MDAAQRRAVRAAGSSRQPRQSPRHSQAPLQPLPAPRCVLDALLAGSGASGGACRAAAGWGVLRCCSSAGVRNAVRPGSAVHQGKAVVPNRLRDACTGEGVLLLRSACASPPPARDTNVRRHIRAPASRCRSIQAAPVSGARPQASRPGTSVGTPKRPPRGSQLSCSAPMVQCTTPAGPGAHPPAAAAARCGAAVCGRLLPPHRGQLIACAGEAATALCASSLSKCCQSHRGIAQPHAQQAGRPQHVSAAAAGRSTKPVTCAIQSWLTP